MSQLSQVSGVQPAYTKVTASDQPVNATQIRPSNQPVLAAINRRVQNAYRRINRRSEGFCAESRVNYTDAINRRSNPMRRIDRR